MVKDRKKEVAMAPKMSIIVGIDENDPLAKALRKRHPNVPFVFDAVNYGIIVVTSRNASRIDYTPKR